MRNDEKKKIAGATGFHALLMVLYMFMMVVLTQDESLIDRQTGEFAIVVTGILLGVEFISVVMVLIMRLLIPHIQKRRAALKALGEHGIQKLAHDEMARLAYKGVYALLEDDFPKAEEYLNLAFNRTDINQNKSFCIEWLIKLYEHIGADDKLLWCFRKAVDLAPDSAPAQVRLGHAYYVDGKLDQAVYCFEQALRYNPNEGYAYYSMAKIHMVRGEDDKALETLNTLLKINENHPLVYAELAVIYAMHGDSEKSEEYFKKAELCGYNESEELNKRITAILKFGQAEDVSGENLPREYYRRIEPKEEKQAEKDEKNA